MAKQFPHGYCDALALALHDYVANSLNKHGYRNLSEILGVLGQPSVLIDLFGASEGIDLDIQDTDQASRKTKKTVHVEQGVVMGAIEKFVYEMESGSEVGNLATKAVLADRNGALRAHSAGEPVPESWPGVIKMLSPQVAKYRAQRAPDSAPGPVHVTLVMADNSKIHYFLIDPKLSD